MKPKGTELGSAAAPQAVHFPLSAHARAAAPPVEPVPGQPGRDRPLPRCPHCGTSSVTLSAQPSFRIGTS